MMGDGDLATADSLLVERRGPVMVLTINRDHRRNSLDAATSAAIDAAVTAAEADDSIGAIILTGAGDRAFCSGMDLKEAAEIGVGHGLIPGRGFGGLTERRRIKPLICAVNGTAVAGGFEIMLAADIVIAADHALFGLSEVKRGLFAFAGGVQRLANRLPRAAGLGLILSGEPVSAARMYDLGLVTEVVPGPDVLPRAMAFAGAMLANSWAAIRNAKLLYDLSADVPIDQSLAMGKAFGMAVLQAGDDASREGVAAYAEKRTADFGDGS